MIDASLIKFLRSMSRMQTEMPDQYQRLIDALVASKEASLEILVANNDDRAMYRAQGGVRAMNELIEKLSTPSQHLKTLEESQ